MIDVAKVSGLANLELKPEESKKFQGQLDAIIGYVQKVREVDVSGVEPTVFGQSVQSAFRDDTPGQTLDREVALKNAPQRFDNEFKVPRIVE